ncbi:hypothetical protein Krac_10876 [Ktedonobacter racemifer DSM 44963]|uniref:Uncharacterized protein n=1 Tax=Ktedonobacter racemifer DSM 44963 TaxID=485913 RepID=D6TIS0_KTERA|nr:hypothetical protein Krac_10876 [Ktedonobacter racemifer DSM 44963]
MWYHHQCEHLPVALPEFVKRTRCHQRYHEKSVTNIRLKRSL